MYKFLAVCLVALAVAACTTQPTADVCTAPLGGKLDAAMSSAADRLSQGCEYQFDSYFQQLLAVAEANPDHDNPMHFSNFLLQVNDVGVISRRQAQALYNRYFGVKFVSLMGDYNTCSQACPQRDRVLSDMRSELQDKELGLLRASADKQGFYRADNLLKETELVLEATCNACEADGQ